MAGLMDQYTFAGNGEAYGMVKKMATWVHARVEACIASGGEACNTLTKYRHRVHIW